MKTTEKNAQQTYIVTLSNSESDSVFAELVKGTEDQVAHYLLHMLETERKDINNNDGTDWDYGDERISDIDRRDVNGKTVLTAGGSWPEFHIVVSARPADTTPMKTLNDKCSWMKKYE